MRKTRHGKVDPILIAAAVFAALFAAYIVGVVWYAAVHGVAG